MKTASYLENGFIDVRFAYTPLLVERVRTLPGRKWDVKEKRWLIPFTLINVENLRKWEFCISDDLKTKEKQEKAQEDKIINLNMPEGLYPFQREGVAFMERANGKALIADEPGLGKTIESLAWLYCHPELRPALIVVPACLKLNWERKAHEWLNHPKVQVLYGKQTPNSIWCNDIVIVNYDLLIMDIFEKVTLAEYLATEMKFKVMIVDECSYISNPDSQRSKAVKRLARTPMEHILFLSGTPITSKPRQFFPVLNILCPQQFSSFFHYAQRYCGAKSTPWGWDFDGASNMEELHGIISRSIMIRRKKEDVLKDLPCKTRSIVPIEINNREDYEKADEDYIAWLESQGQKSKAEKASKAEIIAKTEGLRQLAVKGKLNSVIAWIHNFLDESEEKLVVFTYHVWVRDAIFEHFKNITALSEGGNKVQLAEDKFQNDKNIRIFIGTIASSGMGITLTASSNIVFVEYPWTPDLLEQGEDRAHRIGQKNIVTIHYLIAPNTADEDALEILDRKKVVLSKILDGKEVEDENLIVFLLDQAQERKKKYEHV